MRVLDCFTATKIISKNIKVMGIELESSYENATWYQDCLVEDFNNLIQNQITNQMVCPNKKNIMLKILNKKRKILI